jgi:hypothetical protein
MAVVASHSGVGYFTGTFDEYPGSKVPVEIELDSLVYNGFEWMALAFNHIDDMEHTASTGVFEHQVKGHTTYLKFDSFSHSFLEKIIVPLVRKSRFYITSAEFIEISMDVDVKFVFSCSSLDKEAIASMVATDEHYLYPDIEADDEYDEYDDYADDDEYLLFQDRPRVMQKRRDEEIMMDYYDDLR